MDRGTLCQLRNRNVTKAPKNNVNAAEDFLEVVVDGHILTAVMTYLGMKSLDDKPLPSIVPHELWMEDDDTRRQKLEEIAAHIIDEHVDLATVFKDPHPSAAKGTSYDYACEVLTLGLLNFKDAVREGDGDHIIMIWKYLMLLFKATGRKNYAIEALTLLSQYHIILPSNLGEQLKWSRFISSDLHMEHLNRMVKVSIEGLGSNKSKKAIKRVAKAIGVLAEATSSFDSEVGVISDSGKHSDKSKMKDLKKVLKQLLECDPFNPSVKRTLTSFPHLKRNLLKTLDEERLKDWMIERFSLLSQPDMPPPVTEEDDSDEDDSLL